MRTIECRSDLRGAANRIISIVGVLGLIVGLGGLWTRPARAEIQNDLVGFATNHIFESAEAGEHIDVMTGNMTLTIPMGPRYKLNDNFEYGLTLYYNSKIWEHECDVTSSLPCKGKPVDSTYGLGFSLNAGRIYHHENDKSWVYRIQLEDGAEHFFCDVNDSNYRPNPPNPPDYHYVPPNCNDYTTDASHIHVLYNFADAAQQARSGWRAILPDGRTVKFENELYSGKGWLATRIESAERRPDQTAAVWVEYHYFTGTYQLQYVADSSGRQTRLTDDTAGHQACASTNPDDLYAVVVEVPAFDGHESWAPGTIARYVLCGSTHLRIHDPSEGAPDPDGPLLLIDEIKLPENLPSYRFGYGGDSTASPRFGWIVQRTIPTGAVTDYEYDWYATSPHRPYHTELFAKTLSSEGKSYRWTWRRVSGDRSFPGTSLMTTNPYRVDAVDPFGNLTVYDFDYSLNNTGYQTECYFNTGGCRNNWSDGTLLAQSTYAGPITDSNRLVKRVEFTWDSDPDLTQSPPHKMFQYRATDEFMTTVHATGVNVRQIEARTIIPDSTGNTQHTVRVVHSELSPSGTCSRKVDEYLDDALYRSTYTDSDNPGCAFPHSIEVRDAAQNVVSHVDRVYTSNSSGPLLCEVRRKTIIPTTALTNCSSLALQFGDVATVHVYDSDKTWEEVSTRVQGGDYSTTDLRTTSQEYLQYTPACPPVCPATSEGTGFLKAKRFGDGTANGNLQWYAVNRVVDFNTGLPIQTHDPAGNTTSYRWDGLGRLLEIKKGDPTSPNPAEQSISIAYTNVAETHVRQGLDSNNYIETVYLYDDLGRLVTTKRRNASGTYDVQNTEFDIAGRVARRSEWALDSTPAANLKWTTYDYTIYTDPDAVPGTQSKHADPLGRIHGVTTPDDLSPDTPTTETSYHGNATTVTVRNIKGWTGSVDADTTSTTVYTNDALGRLISVDSSGAGASAKYQYDEANNLTDVRLTDPSNPSQVQTRHFEYDRLGRLRLATNPENGTVQYTTYDARGNLKTFKDARQNTFKMTYDLADRLLTKIQSIPMTRTLVQNTYDPVTSRLTQQDSSELVYSPPSTTPVQQVVSTVRFNYGAVDSAASCSVLPGAGYTGLNGRLSSQTTTIQPWGTELRTDYCEDGLGLPTLLAYPDYANSGRTRSTVQSYYQNGYLTQAFDWGRNRAYINNLFYSPGGVPKEIDRPGSDDIIDLDIRSRPTRFRVYGHSFTTFYNSAFAASGGCQPHCPVFALAQVPDDATSGETGGGGSPGSWDSGIYSYDMAGNIQSIGTQQYRYDALDRLVYASIPFAGQIFTLGFAYDGFGNMTQQSRAASSSFLTSLTRTYTNDWLTNRLVQQDVLGGSSVAYVYDENGNMTAEGSRGFVFDAENRLREVTDPEKGVIGNYDYDASGYRVRAQADGTETFLFRDASGQVLSEFRRPIGNADPPVWNKDYVYAFGKSFALVKNQIPSTPKRPRATNVTTTHLTLTWDAVSDPDILGYHIDRKPPETIAADVQAPTVTWDEHYSSDAGAGCLYYTVLAIDTAVNVGDPSPTLTVCPLAGNPPAPTNVISIRGDRSVTIRWSPVTGTNVYVSGYFVERQHDSTCTTNCAFDRLDDELLSSTEFLDLGTDLPNSSHRLANGSLYKYRVRTVDTANRVSDPTDFQTFATPSDNIPPAKPVRVVATPDRAAGTIVVSWQRGDDPDVAGYYLYRSTVAGDVGGQVGGFVPASQQSTIDAAAPQCSLLYYAVRAIDTSGNLSAASDQVSVRAHVVGIGNSGCPNLGAPSLPTTHWEYDPGTTVSSAGLLDDPPFWVHQADIDAENDDVMKAVVTWSAAAGGDSPEKYRVYRKAPDEDHYQIVGTTDNAAQLSFSDTTIARGSYTYYVTAIKTVNNVVYESAAPSESAGGADHFVRHLPPHTRVRNVVVRDGRFWFSTLNRASRQVTVQWSRVPEPELVGYNVYRTCAFTVVEDYLPAVPMTTFDCEPVWLRLNDTPLPPDQRSFQDSSVAGLQGGFRYAVRPVGLDGVDGAHVEGDIGKVVEVVLIDRTPDFGTPESEPERHSHASLLLDDIPVGYPITDNFPPYNNHNYEPTVTAELAIINAYQHGTGTPTTPVQAPTSVSQSIYGKRPSFATEFAQVSWTMTTPAPRDLLGFYVEAAGSPAGPWKRLNKRPVAWWERQYITQGVGELRCGYPGSYSGHADCLTYRVFAVYESGAASNAAVATTGAPDAQACPRTPDPPANVRASTVFDTNGHCRTKLDWDPPAPGSVAPTEYYVYRWINDQNDGFFYDTQRVVAGSQGGPPTTYTEIGDPRDPTGLTCPDYVCPYLLDGCALGSLDAFYITARGARGGESPRSNLVFWQCTDPDGYVKLLKDAGRTDAIASLRQPPPAEALACWNTGDLRGEQRESLPDRSTEERAPVPLANAKMLRLGSMPDPPAEILDLHTDHLGTVRVITDVYGTIRSSHDYFPFGEEIVSSFSDNTHRFTGHERDQESGLDYMKARYYSPSMGRWLAADSSVDTQLPDPASINRNTYVQDSPPNAIDPDGRATYWINLQLSIFPGGGKPTSRYNYLSHSIAAVASQGTVVETASWSSLSTPNWTLHDPKDMAAAAEAIRNGDAIKLQDDSFDIYMLDAMYSTQPDWQSQPWNHSWFTGTCKGSTYMLILNGGMREGLAGTRNNLQPATSTTECFGGTAECVKKLQSDKSGGANQDIYDPSTGGRVGCGYLCR